ncbi:hypothetical protein D8674_041706 [Pyrus ussuriensis x Pyrus communis]|uniref:Uncharacterized protein n=1 Tax=Pyrus ussuriensis x Pyrus communis TaxID=2448454 RepID=A0A5N5GEI4_9ROSA|nr:hypothetical protein D8674_041706 [Pyrus ussuriensis x Pyrus communis]
MKNDMTITVVAMNLLTPKDNRILSKRSDELAAQDSLAFSVQCADFVSNMGLRLLARTHQVESLTVVVESEGRILSDHQRFVGLFQRYLMPLSSGALPSSEVPNDQPPVPPPSRVLPKVEGRAAAITPYLTHRFEGGGLKVQRMEKVSKKWETSTKKRKAHILVLVDNILFHKGARKHHVLRIAALRKAEVKAPHYTQEIQLEKRKWMAILERYDNGSIINKYHEEMEEYRQKGENDLGDVEDGSDGDRGETESDIVRGSTSDEDDS